MTATDLCPTEHKHEAASTCYQRHGCRCAPCRVATMRTRLRRRKDIAFGRYDQVSYHVPADPARAHVVALLNRGMNVHQIGYLAGITPHVVGVLIDPEQQPKRICRSNSDKLLAVRHDLDALPDVAFVDATPTARRIQALMVIGWSMNQQSRLSGSTHGDFPRFLVADRVTAATHRKVKAVYDELWNLVPEATTNGEKSALARTKNFAARHGWLPPMAWDDIDTDVAPPNPAEVDLDAEDADEESHVDEILIELAMTGEPVRLTYAQRCEATLRLNSRGLADPAIAAVLHIDKRTVLRIRQHLDLRAAVGADKQPIAA